MKTRYYITKDNRLVTSNDVIKSWYLLTGIQITTEDEETAVIFNKMNGITSEVIPSYETLLKHDAKVLAVAKYREDNDCSLREAQEAIDKIEFELECHENGIK